MTDFKTYAGITVAGGIAWAHTVQRRVVPCVHR